MGNLTGPNESTKIDLASINTTSDMTPDRTNIVVSEHTAYQGDLAVYNSIDKAYYGSTEVYGAFPILRKTTTNGSGIATIYLTNDGTSGGTALFSTVYEDGIIVMPVGTANNYQVASIVLSGDKKSIAVTVNTLSTVILGLVTLSTSPSGVEVRAAIWGKS